MFANFLALFQSNSVPPTEFLFPVSFSNNVPDNQQNSMSDYRSRVLALYQKYAPKKVNNIDAVMTKYKGQEEDLITALVGKYGPEPAAPSTAAVVAVAPAPSSFRDRIFNIYAKYAPDKVGNIDTLMEKYKGQEEDLIIALVGKYGPEPATCGGSAAKLAQLQKEHEEALQKLAVLSKQSKEKDDQLRKKDSVISALEVQRVALISLPVLMVAFWWLKPK
jgi:hypothetical protein